MGSLRVITGVFVGAVCLCGLYSGLDIKYGEKGFLCWSAFCLLVVVLGGGPTRGAVAAAMLGVGKVGGLEPFSVLLLSLLCSKILCSNFFAQVEDDLQVDRKPYEEEIRELLFQNDPSRLHLVDDELKRHKGREKHLLRKYEAEFSQAAPIIGAGGHGAGQGNTARGGGGPVGNGNGVQQPDKKNARQKSVVELAQEQEARRVEATLQASLDRIMSRKNNRR